MNYFERMKNFAPSVLRFGLAFVFLWFGFSQIQNPGPWTAFLPDFLSGLPVRETQIVLLNGVFEIVASVLLILGAYTNIVALLLSLHLFGIAFSIGLTATGVRDLGLAISTLALSMLGAGDFSIDSLLKREASQKMQGVVTE